MAIHPSDAVNSALFLGAMLKIAADWPDKSVVENLMMNQLNLYFVANTMDLGGIPVENDLVEAMLSAIS
ncbi:hypothetical protein [Marinobacterium lutimaris]|nr:hypothetical protein [Marinobacterium lutimaris]